MAALPFGYPERVEGVAVRRRSRRVHFLHGAEWVSAEGATIARWLGHYPDRQRQEVPVCYGQGVLGCPFCASQHLPKKVQLG